MTELRIRVKDNIKEALEKIKDSNGISVNFQVNFAIYKYLVLDVKVPLWNLDDRPDPHYETINKLPEDLKFCDGDSCEIDYSNVHDKPTKPLVYANQDKDDLRGDKC